MLNRSQGTDDWLDYYQFLTQRIQYYGNYGPTTQQDNTSESQSSAKKKSDKYRVADTACIKCGHEQIRCFEETDKKPCVETDNQPCVRCEALGRECVRDKEGYSSLKTKSQPRSSKLRSVRGTTQETKRLRKICDRCTLSGRCSGGTPCTQCKRMGVGETCHYSPRCSTNYSGKEDALLVKLAKSDMSWEEIATKFNGRKAESLRRRHSKLHQ